jgi:putative membrane protein
MKESPYSRFNSSDLVLRDELAVDRTLLANERTLLAYLRTAAGLIIAGVSIMHFSTQDWFWAIGIACLPTGIITAIVGTGRYRQRGKSLSAVRRHREVETKKTGEGDT